MKPTYEHRVDKGVADSTFITSNLACTIGLLVLAAAFWFLQTYGTARPQVAPANDSPAHFSAERAEQVLARILGPEKPHPVSTEENARLRARIIAELTALGLHPFLHSGFACHAPGHSAVLICASVSDVISQVIPGEGKAIVLLAHYDSVPAGPGAADDESGAATVIETARALIASGELSRHPVVALLTDGEEADLLGAASFLRDPALKAHVGAVINVEARGNRGPSILFQTSRGDGPLIDLYAQHTSHYATSSLYHEIYRFLPNDTDLTLFIANGFPSWNFAYVGGLFDYHTANDTRVNLAPVSLQEQGDNMLGITQGLEQTDFARLHGDDDIYFDILGRWLPRLPASWALPLGVAAFSLLLAAVFVSAGGMFSVWEWGRALLITPALIVGAAGSGFLIHEIAALISGTPEPAYAYPAALRIALALALGGTALLVSRLAAQRSATAGTWLWISIFAIVAAITVPGISPYFIFPSILAGVLLFATAFERGKWEGRIGTVAVLLAALFNLLVWSAIGTLGEMIAGLKLHVMFTVPFAIGLSTVVPLLARSALPRRAWVVAVLSMFSGASVAAVVQGFQPSYSLAAAQRLNITYFQDKHRAQWAVNGSVPLPKAMRGATHFSSKLELISSVLPLSFVAPAGTPAFALPSGRVIADQSVGSNRRVTVALHGSASAAQMLLEVPAVAKLRAIDIQGWHYDTPSGAFTLACMSHDCTTAQVTLTFAARGPSTLQLYEHRFGLPSFASRVVASRPHWAVQSQNGDGVTLVNQILLPATR